MTGNSAWPSIGLETLAIVTILWKLKMRFQLAKAGCVLTVAPSVFMMFAGHRPHRNGQHRTLLLHLPGAYPGTAKPLNQNLDIAMQVPQPSNLESRASRAPPHLSPTITRASIFLLPHFQPQHFRPAYSSLPPDPTHPLTKLPILASILSASIITVP